MHCLDQSRFFLCTASTRPRQGPGFAFILDWTKTRKPQSSACNKVRAEADVVVRIRPRVVEIQIEQSGIRAIVPIAAADGEPL
jgi:hypothetical protein